MSPVAAVYLVWGLWFLAWLMNSIMATPEAGALRGLSSFALHAVAAIAVLFLLMILSPWPGTDMQYRLWERAVPSTFGWVLVILALGSLAFSVWASIHRITRLDRNDAPVDSGPYAVVRHPFYLGVIVSAVVTAVLFGRPTALVGAVLLTATLVGKVHLEELRSLDAAHLAYRQRVPMFVPFWPMGGADEARQSR